MFYYLTSSRLNETSAVFCLKGPDANTYLQGQFTQELNRPDGTVAYGLFLNQKGKVVADAHILKIATNEFLLISHSVPGPKLRERLENYLIADEVTIEDITAKSARVRVWGSGSAAAVANLIGGQPPTSGVWCEGRDVRVYQGRACAEDNFELLVTQEGVAGIAAELLESGGASSDTVAAEKLRITSGIPSVPADIGPNDLPNEGGLDEVAISYTKGCYLGQEVMARLKNLGQVRRRLHLVRGDGETPAAGAPLFQHDKKIGDLRSVARDGNGFVAMAMLSLVNLDESRGLELAPNSTPTLFITRRV